MFLDLWQGLTLEGSAPPEEDDDAADALRTLDLRLSVYGSATVLKTHRALWGLLAADRLDEPQAREALLSALEAIRKELGAGMIGLTRNDLSTGMGSSTGMAGMGSWQEWGQVLHSRMSYPYTAPGQCRAVRRRDAGNRASPRDGVTGQDDHRRVAWTKKG